MKQTDTKQNLKLWFDWVNTCQEHKEGKAMRRCYLKDQLKLKTAEADENLRIATRLNALNSPHPKHLTVFVNLYIYLAENLVKDKKKLNNELKFLNSKKQTTKITQLDIEHAKTREIASLNLLGDSQRQAPDKYKTICPFHNDTHPSLVVFEETNTFYCFSCNEGGDVIKLVMQTMKLSFIDAVKYLI